MPRRLIFFLESPATQEKLSFKDPKDKAPDANLIAKNWAKGFEQLEHWISLHVDEATGMPLVFAVDGGCPLKVIARSILHTTPFGILFE
jgi:hypothetical protein